MVGLYYDTGSNRQLTTGTGEDCIANPSLNFDAEVGDVFGVDAAIHES